ncbi:NADH-quinone oxidoreductase subunit J/K [candidate division KSB3 bacterium]|uniref:NADH-quinone oxidoreductase subunit J/K n=1 Tax=candidate division KSB3 bacterium TaxID=2044937 RepID=A0A2G6K8U8_9BACT|nr:MAG: NADH-quinone oxidoreductase subunit J/K [candidate division KSB3 bacterium]
MKTILLVCGDIGCSGYGSQAIFERFQELQEDWFEIRLTGCQGFCAVGPVLEVRPGNIFYQHVQVEDVEEILEASKKGRIVSRLLYRDPETKQPVQRVSDVPFYRKQKKIVLRTNGQVAPDNITHYLEFGGYEAWKKALTMSPESLVELVERSGLRGRGGGGFATGRKWRSVFKTQADQKYIICNGDEGDPGAFMDRSLMQGTPHAILEGIMIGAYAIGANQGYIYVRDEYPMAVKNLQHALEDARKLGFLGTNILDLGFDFDITIKRGAGAFVCGESSALMRSIEGKIGEPNEKYIHASEHGLWGKPTVLNNVETFANIPYIILEGAEAFRQLGTKGSPGTKVFCLVGKIQNAGLIEVEMGTTLREIIFNIGGGIPRKRSFKAVQTGGPSGGCIPADYLDTPIDFDSLNELGSMMGSGGMIIMDNCDCMVEVARYFTKFLIEESCGRCTPCREGLVQVFHILEKITHGSGAIEDIARLEELGEYIASSSLCGLGKSAPNPLLSTIRYFRDEYLEHIQHTRCPAGVCKALTTFTIDRNACVDCGACFRVCPVNAISQDGGHHILQETCIRCGECQTTCHFNAIRC